MNAKHHSAYKGTPALLHAATGLGALALGIFLAAALLDLPKDERGLTAHAKAHMAESGVEHPVTAVLLNFRAYDTWLEVGVLLMAVMGMLLFQRRSDLMDIKPMPSAEPVLHWLIRLLFPMMVLVAGYLLWMGKFSSGGAFQAGVVLGAGGVLLWLAGHPSVSGFSGRLFRFLLTIGFASFMAVAAINVFFQQLMLDFPVAHAGTIILLLESTATISIAVTVAALIVGLQPVRIEEHVLGSRAQNQSITETHLRLGETPRPTPKSPTTPSEGRANRPGEPGPETESNHL